MHANRMRIFQSSHSRLAIGAVLVASVLFAGSTAHAAGQALLGIGWKVRGFGIGTYAQNLQPGTAMNFAVADVGSTAVTPSVMWAANQFSGMKQGSYGPYTQYGYPTISSMRQQTYTDQGGALQRSHAGAPAGITTLMAEAVATTSCVVPGSCFASHPGTLTVNPGTRQFGGSAKFLRRSVGVGLATSTVGGNRTVMFSANGTPNPQVKSNAYVRLDFTAMNTSPAFPTPSYQTNQFVIGGSYTTGTVMARHTLGATSTETGTGSFNLNGTNNTGTISVVIPRLAFENNRCQDKFDTPAAAAQTSGNADGFCDTDGTTAVSYLGTPGASSSATAITLTFLPEPAQFSMLAAGVLALVGAGGLRRRR